MTKPRVLVLLVAALLVVAVAAAIVVPRGKGDSAPAGWKLTWGDEFDGAANAKPDPAKWGYDLGSLGVNNELEFYTDSTANVRQDGDGRLEIVARKERREGWDYTSGRILTRDRFTTKYGRIEARIKLPAGQGIWPAFWMLGEDLGKVGWPAAGEVDIMENIGREPAVNHGSLHGPGYSGGSSLTGSVALRSGTLADAFHDYAIEWSPRAITFFFDGDAYETKRRGDQPAGQPWVFDHPFFLLLNVAVGGDWPGSPDATTTFPQTMSVDRVRVYRRTGPDTEPPTTPEPGATHKTPRSITIGWHASADESAVAGYDVFRGAAKVATTKALAVRVTGLKPATLYTFSVRARDTAGNVSPRSTGIVVRTCKATRKRC